jgi:hypothetical protein
MPAHSSRFVRSSVLIGILAAFLLLLVQPAFAQTPPTISSVTPSVGPAAGGTQLSIVGTGFEASTEVTFNGTPGTVTNQTATTLTVVTPPGSVGSAVIGVSNSHGTNTFSGFFAYQGPAPTVASVSPNSGTSLGGTSVTVTGTGFQTGASVTFGGTAATNVVFVNDTTITATTPARPAGAVTVSVTNTDGQSGSAASAYTYVAASPPSVTSITPTSGPTTGGTNVTIAGANFASGATVSIGGIAATNVIFDSGAQLRATTAPRAAGTVNVVVTNPDSQSGTLANGFTYAAAAPVVTSINPTTGTTSGGTVVTVTGSGFVSGATVRFGGTLATNVIFDSATQVRATTPARTSTGAVSVQVTNPNNQSGQLNNAFTYTLGTPTVTSVVPNSGPVTGGTNVTITGNGFVTGAVVRFGNNNATSVTIVSPTQITATTPSQTSAGAVTVQVRNSSTLIGQLTNGFTYTSGTPTVTAVSPNSGTTGGGTPVTITGTNFISGATVRFAGTQATSVVVVNSTTITAVTPARSTTGSVTVEVRNPNNLAGQRTNAFTYVSTPAPVVAAVSPVSGPLGGGNVVTITGTGFNHGAAVRFGTRNATNVTWVSSTQLTVTVPSATSSGAVDVRVTNTDGKNHTRTNAYTYVGQPTITSISPTSGTTAGGTQVTVTGTNFVSGMSVWFGGIQGTNVNVLSSTSLTVRTPPRGPGVVSVVVSAPGTQQATLSNAFTYQSSPPGSGTITGGTFPTRGVGIFVWGGGTNEQLTAAAVAAGCPAVDAAFFATVDGKFITLIPLAPTFVNQPWFARYPQGVPANTALLGVCKR